LTQFLQTAATAGFSL